jgi:hypothetical protein
MACRLNGDGKNFDKAATNLARTAQVALSGETLRTLVEAEGKRVLQAQRSGQLPLDWSAADCQVEGQVTTRIYVGSDGVMVPPVTDAEKTARRQRVKEKRRRRGRKARPLPPRKPGADQRYKEFKIVAFYDEAQEHRRVTGTRGDGEAAGRLMPRDAGRIRLDLADQTVGNVDGSPWIRHQVERQSLPWTPWGWTSTPSARTCTRRGGRSTATTMRRARSGPAGCSTSSSTTATRRPGRSCWSGGRG